MAWMSELYVRYRWLRVRCGLRAIEAYRIAKQSLWRGESRYRLHVRLRNSQ